MAKYSNCLIFALGRIFKKGGYLVIRKSRFGWWPHFLWGQLNEEGLIEVEHYQPLQPDKTSWLRYFPIHTLLFKGKVVQSDLPEPTESQADASTTHE